MTPAHRKPRRGRGGGTRPGLMRNGDFVKFWLGETVSLFGAQVTTLALPLTAVLSLKAGPAQIGALQFATYLPYVFLAMPFGVLVDRHRKRPLMIGANLSRAVLIGVVPLLAWLHVLNLPALWLISLGVGIGTVLFDVCWLSYVPVIVEPEHLVTANSRLAGSWSAAAFAGPGLGGMLVQILTAPFALIANSCSYVVSVLSLCAIQASEGQPRAARRHLGKEIAEGLGFIVRQPFLRVLVTTGASYNFFYVFMQALWVVYAVRTLGFDPGLIGIVMGVGAVGGILGAVLASTLVNRLPFGRVHLASVLVGYSGPLLIATSAPSKAVTVVVVTAGFFLMETGLALSNTTGVSLRQTVTPPELMGRMNAGMRTLMWGPQSIGSLAGGFAGGLLGLHAGMWIAAVGVMLSAAPVVFSKIPRLRELPPPAKSLVAASETVAQDLAEVG